MRGPVNIGAILGWLALSCAYEPGDITTAFWIIENGDAKGIGSDGGPPGDLEGADLDVPAGDANVADAGPGDLAAGDTLMGDQQILFGPWQGVAGSQLGPWNVTLGASASGGGVSASVGRSQWVDIAVRNVGGDELVATGWAERQVSGQSRVRIAVYNPRVPSWSQLMGLNSNIATSTLNSSHLSVAINNSGHIYVAWSDTSSGHNEIYFALHDGSNWSTLGSGDSGGGVSNTAAESTEPRLILDATDSPVIVWNDGGNIYLRRWSGAAWVALGGSDAGSGLSTAESRAPDVAFDSSFNRLVVTWEEGLALSSQIMLRRWTGTLWEELGGSATGYGVSNTMTGSGKRPSLSVSAGGVPVLAWVHREMGLQFSGIHVAQFVTGAWSALGTSRTSSGLASSAGHAESPAMTHYLGQPVVVWSQEVPFNGPHIYGRSWNGMAWVDVGAGSASSRGISATVAASRQPAVAAMTKLYLAWEDDTPMSGREEIYLKEHFTGAWSELGSNGFNSAGLSATDGNSDRPQLARLVMHPLAAAWTEDADGTNQVLLKRADGSSWVGVGTSATSMFTGGPEHADTASLATLGDDISLVWEQSSMTTDEIYWRQFDGGWSGAFGSDSGSGLSGALGNSKYPTHALGGDGTPWVAFSDWGSGRAEIYVKKLDVAGWVGVAGSEVGAGISNTSRVSRDADLAIDENGYVVVAWTEFQAGSSDIWVRKYDNVTWRALAGGPGIGLSGTFSDGISPALAIDHQDRPIVAWQDDASGIYQIYVRRFDGAIWQPLGAGSATGNGVSRSNTRAINPAIAIDDFGRPVLAWMDASTGNFEIYLRRFNGAEWLEVSASASGGGVSNSSAPSMDPSVSTGPRSICVAWSEAHISTRQITARCSNGP